MGATDFLYRLFDCFSVGDVAKNGQGNSATSGSESTGSQNQGLAMAPPSGATSCWCGFLNGSSRLNATTTRIGVDTAKSTGSIREPPQLNHLFISNLLKILGLALNFRFLPAQVR